MSLLKMLQKNDSQINFSKVLQSFNYFNKKKNCKVEFFSFFLNDEICEIPTNTFLRSFSRLPFVFCYHFKTSCQSMPVAINVTEVPTAGELQPFDIRVKLFHLVYQSSFLAQVQNFLTDQTEMLILNLEGLNLLKPPSVPPVSVVRLSSTRTKMVLVEN